MTITVYGRWWWGIATGLLALVVLGLAGLTVHEVVTGHGDVPLAIWWVVVCGGSAAFMLWTTESFTASYRANEAGVERLGLLGRTSLRWEELGGFRVRTWGGGCAYLIYDRQGRRRVVIDFQALGRAGQPLLQLLHRKLDEFAPDAPHVRPLPADWRFWRKQAEGALTRKPHGREVLAVCALVALCWGASLAVPASLHHGSMVRLLLSGRTASGTVQEVKLEGRLAFVVYRWRVPGGRSEWKVGAMFGGQGRKLREGDRVVIRYQPGRPQVQVLQGDPRLVFTRISLLVGGGLMLLAGVLFGVSRRYPKAGS